MKKKMKKKKKRSPTARQLVMKIFGEFTTAEIVPFILLVGISPARH